MKNNLNYEKLLLKINLAEAYMNLADKLIRDMENIKRDSCLKKSAIILEEIRQELKNNAD